MEYIGYIATFIVLSSFLMKNLTNLRDLNSVGASLFIIYGLFISSVPVILTNGLILIINVTKLLQDKLKDGSFKN